MILRPGGEYWPLNDPPLTLGMNLGARARYCVRQGKLTF